VVLLLIYLIEIYIILYDILQLVPQLNNLIFSYSIKKIPQNKLTHTLQMQIPNRIKDKQNLTSHRYFFDGKYILFLHEFIVEVSHRWSNPNVNNKKTFQLITSNTHTSHIFHPTENFFLFFPNEIIWTTYKKAAQLNQIFQLKCSFTVSFSSFVYFLRRVTQIHSQSQYIQYPIEVEPLRGVLDP